MLLAPEFLPSQYIGPQLRAARERAGLRQSDIARRLRVDPAVISRWEFPESTRYRPVPGKHLEALAQELEVPLEDLVPGLPRSDDATDAGADPSDEASPTSLPPPPFRNLTSLNASPMVCPQRVPGRPATPNADGVYELRLRCPACRTLNTSCSDDPNQLPSQCSTCGRRLRARVIVSLMSVPQAQASEEPASA